MKTYQAKDFEIELHADKIRWSTGLLAWKTIAFDDIDRVRVAGNTLTVYTLDNAFSQLVFQSENDMRQFQWDLAQQAVAA